MRLKLSVQRIKADGEQKALLPHKLMLAIILVIRTFVAAAAAVCVCVCMFKTCLFLTLHAKV
jgi:hypothetical protein